MKQRLVYCELQPTVPTQIQC